VRRSFIETRPRKIFQREKYRTNELAWVFVAQMTQYAKLMLRIILSSVAYLSVPFFSSPYLINGTSFWKTLLRVKFVYRFPLLRSSEMFLILKRTRWNIFIDMHSSKQIFQLFLYDFNEIEFSENIFGVSCNIKFNENSPCGGLVFYADRGSWQSC
jgi:hypothetical protein